MPQGKKKLVCVDTLMLITEAIIYGYYLFPLLSSAITYIKALKESYTSATKKFTITFFLDQNIQFKDCRVFS